MPRRPEEWSVIDRGRTYWYYKFNEWTSYKATDVKVERNSRNKPTKQSREEAEAWARIKYEQQEGTTNGEITFGEFADPFYDWNRCPRIKRLQIDDANAITERHAYIERNRLLNHVLGNPDSEVPENKNPDPIINVRLVDMKRDDVVAFKNRLVQKLGHKEVVNKTLGLLNAILSEAEIQNRINRSPYYKIGKIKTRKGTERGVFSPKEMKALFATIPGPWRTIMEYALFYCVAMVGGRRGEVLALQWKHVFARSIRDGHSIEEPIPITDREAIDKLLTEARRSENGLSILADIRIERAVKSFRTAVAQDYGTPKNGKARLTPAPGSLIEVLRQWQLRSTHTGPDDLVFCMSDGRRLGETWWRKTFERALRNIGIDDTSRVERKLVPHSFRHSLNMILKRAGIQDEKIRAALGWANPEIQEVYTHWEVDDLLDLADNDIR